MSWAPEAVFYHIYPLGLCGAPHHNDFNAAPVARLETLQAWLPHLVRLGVNALYLGPLFEASSHGYDTADYFQLDRRLGTQETLASLAEALHQAGIRLILDGVFHHVGRHFWAFRDLQAQGPHSRFKDWFAGVNFQRRSPLGDAFSYEGWSGHHELVKLNLHHPEVRAHLFAAIHAWIQAYDIDGLRLDVADALDLDFLRALASHCRQLKPDFYLVGEVIHGDYRRWAGPGLLDAVTNYECYKGLYSSHNDRNYFEIAHSLNRQFGPGGLYQDLPLYAFADNHDVTRVASALREPAHLLPLYTLLFTMPGVPSLYYGSEWGLTGHKQQADDWNLRPALPGPEAGTQAPHPSLAEALARLAWIRRGHPALQRGSYQPLQVASEQLAFQRRLGDQVLVIMLNASAQPVPLEVPLGGLDGRTVQDLLDPTCRLEIRRGRLRVEQLPPRGARILALT